MSAIQKFFLAVLPRGIGQAMEKESRLWTLRCPTCGDERSYWEAGGIRYLAAGRPRKLRRCGHCGNVVWLQVYKKD